MKRTIMTLCFLFFFLALPAQALAAQIAVVDLQAILQESNPGKEAMQLLKKYQKDLSSELKKKKRSLDELKQEIQQQSMMLSEEAKKSKRSEFQKQARAFRSSYQQYQQKLKQKERKIREPIIDVLMNIIQEYGKKHNYDIIIDKRNSGIMYNKEELDITDTIIQKLNTAWKKQDKEIKSPKQ